MSRRFPIVATLVVALAIGTMIALGFWQLHRLSYKEALLARYAQNQAMNSDAAWPSDAAGRQNALFRHATLDCRSAERGRPGAGHDASGRTGWAHTAICTLADGTRAEIVLGWSQDPRIDPAWRGGVVQGVIAPGAGDAVRLIAAPPLAGLAANAVPDPSTVPNNHLSYAVQWFLFALTAAVIYAIALRARLRR